MVEVIGRKENFLFVISAYSSIESKRSPYNGFHFSFVSCLLTLQYLSSRHALIILRIVASPVCMLPDAALLFPSLPQNRHGILRYFNYRREHPFFFSPSLLAPFTPSPRR
ncbi:hypothetical protein PUN28_017154 [Cardiocondyla obscurior]|uniref:Uncharacterized protein n=1 Tax=Cardiocondyla obscurior TaxID=286306 RepID=A0AAW2EPT0_9HYME